MIIWTGWGILVPLFITLGAGGVGLLAEELFGVGAGSNGALVGALLAAFAIFLLGRRLNKPEQGYHPKTGEPVVYRNRHTFFFVPMQYWSAIIPVIGLIVTVITMIKGTA